MRAESKCVLKVIAVSAQKRKKEKEKKKKNDEKIWWDASEKHSDAGCEL